MDLVTLLSGCQTKVQLRSKTARAQSGVSFVVTPTWLYTVLLVNTVQQIRLP